MYIYTESFKDGKSLIFFPSKAIWWTVFNYIDWCNALMEASGRSDRMAKWYIALICLKKPNPFLYKMQLLPFTIHASAMLFIMLDYMQFQSALLWVRIFFFFANCFCLYTTNITYIYIRLKPKNVKMTNTVNIINTCIIM